MDSNLPLISVIVPVYKVEKYLDRCVESIVNQTYSNLEIILVDDGSPDNCPQMCDEWAKKDERIRVIHKKNGGLSDARNAGIDWAFSNSSSEWISFIDSDDWIHKMYFTAMIQAMKKTKSSVIVSLHKKTEEENVYVDEHNLEAKLRNTEEFYCNENVNFCVAWGKLYKKNDFLKLRYPIGKIHEDEFTTWKILFQYSSIAVIEEPLYAYWQNPQGIMNSQWNLERLVVLDAFDERIKWMKKRKKFKNAYIFTLRERFNYAIYCINKIENDFPNQANTLRKLKKNMGHFLLSHPIEFPFKKYRWYYEIAYPILMRFYWIVNGKMNK